MGAERVRSKNSSSIAASLFACRSLGELSLKRCCFLPPSVVPEDLCSFLHPDPCIAKQFQLKSFLKLLCILMIHRLSCFLGCRKPPSGSPQNIFSRTQNEHAWRSTVSSVGVFPFVVPRFVRALIHGIPSQISDRKGKSWPNIQSIARCFSQRACPPESMR